MAKAFDTNMENTKEIKINIPEGYEIDKKNSTFENIILKKIEDKKPKSWDEHSKIKKKTTVFSPLRVSGGITNYILLNQDNNFRFWNDFNTQEEAKAFCALGKLIQLRDAWWGDWKPNWTDGKWKYLIYYCCNEMCLGDTASTERILVFPTNEMRNEFYETFKDLIKEAKMFL